MHRRELVLRAGGYDEDVKVLIDWNINRKLSFLADFVHVQKVTGEYFVHRKDSDRISDVQRRDRGKYMQNMRRIKADLPPEPWPFVRRVGVVLPLYGNSERERRVVKHVIDGLDYPCRIAFVDASEESTAVPEEVLELNNVQRVECRNTAPEEAYLAGAKALNADLYYMLDSCAATEVQHRLTRGVHYLENCGADAVRWAEDDSESGPWNVLVTSEDLFNDCDRARRLAAFRIAERRASHRGAQPAGGRGLPGRFCASGYGGGDRNRRNRGSVFDAPARPGLFPPGERRRGGKDVSKIVWPGIWCG
jgi:hypothetical protein